MLCSPMLRSSPCWSAGTHPRLGCRCVLSEGVGGNHTGRLLGAVSYQAAGLGLGYNQTPVGISFSFLLLSFSGLLYVHLQLGCGEDLLPWPGDSVIREQKRSGPHQQE